MINKIVLRNTLISVALIIALMVVVIIRDRVPYGRNQSSFAVSKDKEISRIDLSEDGQRVSLVKSENAWLVDGKYESRKSAVSRLLGIIGEMRIKSPVSDSVFAKETSGSNVHPVKVKVYTGNRLMKTFLVYRTTSNVYGNIMKMSERARPFIVYVPGFEEDIGSAFSAGELFWRPFTVFNLLPSEISLVEIRNHSDTASSFTITADEGKYLLSGAAGWDSSRVRRYISYFTYIPFESWAAGADDALQENIMTGNPFLTVRVVKPDGRELILSLWEKYDSSSGTKDTDRLYGKLNAMDDLFIIRYFDIDPVLKKRSYFYVE